MDDTTYELAHKLAAELQRQNVRLVLAESCTSGMAAAALADIPGISDYFCGSLATYRNQSKAEWLGVSPDILSNPKIGPVSPLCAEQMCLGALQRTSEADVAASVTGHLGPNAPAGLDGVVFIAVSRRGGPPPVVQRRTLTEILRPARSLRQGRQRLATEILFEALLQFLANGSASKSR